MRLDDMLDVANLAAHVAAGTVAEVRHPTEPLRLYNYTQRCQFTAAWDPESRACRGLIVDDDNEIVARPFPKFHNLHEHGPDSHAGTIDLVSPLRVFDKLDGSLGIAYRRPSDGRTAWATRGSFTSEQAQWATDWWQANHGSVILAPYLTYLAEIIYPANRIVLDYGDRAGLTLLAALDADGRQVAPTGAADNVGWPGDIVIVFDVAEHVGQIDPNRRPDTEGYVVLSADGLTRVKLKADEYMRLHKIVTGVSTVTVWELLSNGDPIDVLYEKVPDEFAAWAKSTVAGLEQAFADVCADAANHFERLRHLLPNRKAFAAEAVQSPHRALLFAMADDKDCTRLIWKTIKPERSMPFTVDADAA